MIQSWHREGYREFALYDTELRRYVEKKAREVTALYRGHREGSRDLLY